MKETVYALRTLAITLDDLMAHYHLGVIYEKNNQGDEARREFTKIVAKNPRDAAGYYHLAMLNLHQGNKTSARASIQEGLEADPQNGFLKELLQEISV